MSLYFRRETIVDAVQWNGSDIPGGFVNHDPERVAMVTVDDQTILVGVGQGILPSLDHIAGSPQVLFVEKGDYIVTFPDAVRRIFHPMVFDENYHKLVEITPLTSDGYHTFQELYDHRHALWVLVLRQYPLAAFRTHKTKDGRETPGWFIAGINTVVGQISYHMPDTWWDRLDFLPEIERNFDYDNHNANDVLERLGWLSGISESPVVLKG